ncbi:PASTA domain-containing protein, partial [Escherichia coli]|uniref:PASTA domain-containing protein n=2 Tax=Bacteria TaxID=2 RepID=UPI0028976789
NNLKLGEVTEVYHDTAPERTIVETSIGAGEMVPRDTTIDVKISKGREPVKVPNVVGKTITEAEKILSDLGLTTQVSRQSST